MVHTGIATRGQNLEKEGAIPMQQRPVCASGSLRVQVSHARVRASEVTGACASGTIPTADAKGHQALAISQKT